MIDTFARKKVVCMRVVGVGKKVFYLCRDNGVQGCFAEKTPHENFR